MNLVNEAWIPVVKKNGEKEEVSLKDIFVSGNAYADLAVRPHERVALMRFLICIAQAALNGPENYEQWKKTRDMLPDKAEAYLTKWQDSFNLFDPKKPFLQIAGLDRFDPKSKTPTPVLCSLDFTMATGDKTTLFDHLGSNQERKIGPDKIAIGILTFQNFSLCGTGSNACWSGVKIAHTGNLDAPCASGSMYHAFIKGPDLPTTITLNLLTKRSVEMHYGKEGWGVPIWEKFPQSLNDENAISNSSETYLMIS